jgi:hypothetical protein
MQPKLDRLFDKGYLRRSEIDTVLLDDIESEWRLLTGSDVGWAATNKAIVFLHPWWYIQAKRTGRACPKLIWCPSSCAPASPTPWRLYAARCCGSVCPCDIVPGGR